MAPSGRSLSRLASHLLKGRAGSPSNGFIHKQAGFYGGREWLPGGSPCLRQQGRSISSDVGSPGANFGIAFDIDGVLLLGTEPIESAPRAMARLHHNLCWLSEAKVKVPYVFLTNGGGVLESEKAAELSQLLDVPITGDQVVLGHTPFKSLLDRFGDKRVLTVGKGHTARVMKEYGFRRAVAMEDYVWEFPHMDPMLRYKPWMKPPPNLADPATHGFVWQEGPDNVDERTIDAVFIVSDPVDCGRDIQVLCDVLSTGGRPGTKSHRPPPPLFFAADDFEYQAKFPTTRLGMGAFRIMLQAVYFRLTGRPLEYEAYGKPHPEAYRTAQAALQRLTARHSGATHTPHPPLRTIYMVGDNPFTDVLGARKAGPPWFSILTRTGCHQEPDNHPLHPAHKVVEDVEEAIHFIAERERLQ